MKNAHREGGARCDGIVPRQPVASSYSPNNSAGWTMARITGIAQTQGVAASGAPLYRFSLDLADGRLVRALVPWTSTRRRNGELSLWGEVVNAALAWPNPPPRVAPQELIGHEIEVLIATMDGNERVTRWRRADKPDDPRGHRSERGRS